MSQPALQRMPTIHDAVDTTDEMLVKAKPNDTRHSEQFYSTTIRHDDSSKKGKRGEVKALCTVTYVNSIMVNELLIHNSGGVHNHGPKIVQITTICSDTMSYTCIRPDLISTRYEIPFKKRNLHYGFS